MTGDGPGRRGRRRRRRRRAARRDPPRRPLDARRVRRAGRPAARAAARVRQRDPARPRPRLVLGRDRRRGRAGPRRWSPAARCCSTTTALFALAAGIEGHPDNVAPALLGGFVISRPGRATSFYAVASAVDPRIGAVVFVPPNPVSTEVARGLLPADGAARGRGRQRRPGGAAGRRAGRPARAAAGGRPATACTRSYRRPAMPASLALVDALRGRRRARRWSRAPGRRCWRSPTARARRRRPSLLARCPAGWTPHAARGRPARRPRLS